MVAPTCSTSKEGATLPARRASRRRTATRRPQSGWRGWRTDTSSGQGSSASVKGTFLYVFAGGDRLAAGRDRPAQSALDTTACVGGMKVVVAPHIHGPFRWPVVRCSRIDAASEIAGLQAALAAFEARAWTAEARAQTADRRERAGAGSGGRRGLRGDDRASRASDRRAAARAVRPQLGTRRPPDRSDGVAARGPRGRRHRRRDRRTEGSSNHARGKGPGPPPGPQAIPGASAARAGGGRGSLSLLLLLLRLRPHREDGGGCDRDARGCSSAVEGDPDRPREVAGAPPVHASNCPLDSLPPCGPALTLPSL